MKLIAAALALILVASDAKAACPESLSVKKGMVVDCDLECVNEATLKHLMARSTERDRFEADVTLLRTTLDAKQREHASTVKAYEEALANERKITVKALEDSGPAWWLVGSAALLLGVAGGYYIAKN